ncbi:Zn(II)2Cys6 transcription factor domain-containing protein [Aspergillus mulundensis]|uniref:Zn(II)2Cys6 transcription factor n=1 Tax=Aspergillus mulundensis TaxID=1810919 RepID=A0A3D8SK43_9EURO|nr:hypothetical protein DSM5745_03315 [Aspergillus mulundensis]RDW86673.1 hypothetical protein DSM5745_03315 [Aspergillus mulundensis]
MINKTSPAPQRLQSSRDVARAVCGVGSEGASLNEWLNHYVGNWSGDERKPRCQNCIDKNFDCSYGLQVTFLAKNSFTVSTDEDGTIRKKGGYSKIQFVNEDPLSIDNLVTQQVSSPESTGLNTPPPLPPSSPSRSVRHGQESHRHSISNPVLDRETQRDDGHTRLSQGGTESNHTYPDVYSNTQNRTTLAPWELDGHASAHPNSASTLPVTLEPPIAQSTFSAKDEFAVRGLLALGTQPLPAPSGGTGSITGVLSAGPDALESRRTGPDLVAGSPGRVLDAVPPIFVEGLLQPAVDQGISGPTAHSILNFDMEAPKASSHSHVHDMSNSNPISGSSKMKLLQHYRYNVAPWTHSQANQLIGIHKKLDIHDLSHPFGITALQTAVNSSSGRLLNALLALSETCLRVQKGRNYRHTDVQAESHTFTHELQGAQSEDTVAQHSDIPDFTESFTIVMLLLLFRELKDLVADVARAWAKGSDGFEHDFESGYGRSRDSDYEPLLSLENKAYELDLDSAIFWMFLRMDLGKSLANNTPLRVHLPTQSLPNLSLIAHTENTHERVGHYAQVLLWLCGNALNIYHQQDSDLAHVSRQGPGPESWLQVFEGLSQWHYLRPQEFQPMVELSHDGSHGLNAGSEFPTLLFTNGAGALCTQLYHTAMLHMLECKPRMATALLSRHHQPRSPVLSPLWHAHRVCGIALNNDRAECWDPCLLASFLHAARHMTHESQQIEIVRGFERIQALTGWGVGEYLTTLREEWSFLDGDDFE